MLQLQSVFNVSPLDGTFSNVSLLTICMLGNFACFCLLICLKINSFKIIFGIILNVSSSLNTDQVCRGYEHATKVVKGKRLQN